MKIERISESQLKLTLTRDDLKERDIQLEDLINPSEKTQKLFRDIMEQTLDEQDFLEENTPLMVEAVPVGIEGIMIFITKIDAKDKKQSVADALTQSKKLRQQKNKPMDIEESAKDTDKLLIYSLDSLDDAIHASLRIVDEHQGDSSLYKNNNRFFLVLQTDTYHAENDAEALSTLLDEYGQKHVSTPLAKYYLVEHGEPLIESNAVKTLAKTFGK